MIQKILRLAKKLNQFNIQDLQLILEENSEIIAENLEQLIDGGKIKQVDSENYIFIQEQKKQDIIVNPYYFTEEELKNLDLERKSLNYLPAHVKLKIDKYLKLLKEVNNIKSSKLKEYIKNVWNVKHPEMKSSLTTFRRNRKKLKETGVKGLIPASIVLSRAASYVNNDIYKVFRKYLSENKDKTLKQNYINLKESFMQTNPEIQEWEFPSYAAITIKINKEISALSSFKNTKSEFETFKEAAIHYMEVISQEKKFEPATIRGHKGHLKQHLIPFFNDTKLKDIDLSVVEEYKKFIITSGKTSENGLRNHLILLKKILGLYSTNKISFPTSKKILEKDFKFRR